jgi:hypothetical protein
MTNTALQRITQAVLTNKSGGSAGLGAVVIVDSANASAFTTTTTTGYLNGMVGVVIEPSGIANNAAGLIAFGGPVPQINLSGSASIGDLVRTTSVAGQGVRHGSPVLTGDFAIVIGTGTSPAAILWGLPAGATGSGSGNFSGPGSSVAHNLVGFADTTGLVGEDSGLGKDGWIAAEAWTYVSADGPTGVFNVAADVTGKYQAGARVKYTQSATVKYGIITKVGAFSGGNTPITIYGGTDYTLANAAISATYYSLWKAPFGFNLDPVKWAETFTDTTIRTQTSPVSGTWYNVGSQQLDIPIGAWRVWYELHIEGAKSATTGCDVYTTLSTANNSESDTNFTAYQLFAGASGSIRAEAPVHKEGRVNLASKTTYFLNMKTGTASMADIDLRNDLQKLVIKAECAYV